MALILSVKYSYFRREALGVFRVVRELAVITHEDFMLHEPPDSNPERPKRLARALESLEKLSELLPKGRRVVFTKSPRASLSFFRIVHSSRYLERLRDMLRRGGATYIDSDTYISPGTRAALERLAGASMKAVSYALSGKSSLVAARPPSHHAGFDGRARGSPSQGFCLVNATAAIANVLANHGGVAVVDFDAHHGNGTAEIFYSRSDVLHIDLHFDPRFVFPFTGRPSEIGAGGGEGTKLNIVFPMLAGDDIALDSLKLVDVALKSWSPDYVVVSAGFDSYRGDYDMVPSNIGTKFYYSLGRIIASRAKRAVVAVLEGGYGAGLERALQAFVLGLLGSKSYPWDPLTRSSRRAMREYLLFKLELLLHIYDKDKIEIPYHDKKVLSEISKAILAGTRASSVLWRARKLTI
ncbi:MAG: histone deacetylase family protein [Acidilobaceae archaeon]